jgi:hypothetical protein
VTSGTVSFSLTRKNLHCPNSSALDPIHRAWNPIFLIELNRFAVDGFAKKWIRSRELN